MHNQFEELTKVLTKATSVPKLADELTPDELSKFTSVRLDNMMLIQDLINSILKDINTNKYADISVLETLSVLNDLSKEYK